MKTKSKGKNQKLKIKNAVHASATAVVGQAPIFDF
jgi:hypothetical protein